MKKITASIITFVLGALVIGLFIHFRPDIVTYHAIILWFLVTVGATLVTAFYIKYIRK
jgi:hypothetical protein